MILNFAKKILNFLFFTALCVAQISAMEEVSVEQYEDLLKNRYEHARLERPLSFFEKLNIALSPTASKELPLVFNQAPGLYFINYNLDGKPIGQLIQTDDAISFTSHDPQNYDFLIQNPIKTCKLIIDALGRFVFEKQVDTDNALISSKSVEFLDTFSSKSDLYLQTEHCDNHGKIACTHFSFEGNQFNCMNESSLTAKESIALLAKQGLYNDGQITCNDNALINTPLFENWGALNAGNLVFENGSILNEGSLQIDNTFIGSGKSIDHRGNLKVGNDCIFENISNVTTTQSSLWNIGNNWKAQISKLYLAGNTLVGNLSLFNIASHAILSGVFRSPIIHVDSNDLITCDFPARLIASHYIGLKAKGGVNCQGDLFKHFTHETSNTKKLDESLTSIFPHGVFLHSAQNSIKKSGTILSRSGTVRLDANKKLIHSGVTDAGLAQDAMILMNATSLNLEKASILKSLNARLVAQEELKQQGEAVIKQQLSLQAPEIIHLGSSQAGEFIAQGNNITASSTSHISGTENISLQAEENLKNKGTITTPGQLAMNGENISLEVTSDVQAKDSSLNARETLENKGSLNSTANLFARGKYLDNEGDIAGENIYLKADRRWWNKCLGTVHAERQLRIDALLSMNTLGLLQAEDLTINAAVDLNLLGIYRAKKMRINALIGLNAGLLVPKFDSLEDALTLDNIFLVGDQLLRFVPGSQCAQLGVKMYKGTRLGIGIYKGLANLYEQGPKLFEHAKEAYNLENAGVSDWIPVLCGAKNLAMGAYQIGQMGYDGGKMLYDNYHHVEFANTNTPTPQPEHPNASEQKPTEINWQAVGDQAKSIASASASSVASIFGPQMSRDMLIDINVGAMLGVNGSSNSIWNVNSGLCAFANNYSINTRYGSNRGFVGAGNLNIQASGTYNNARALAANIMFIQADTFKGSEGSTINATQTHITTNALDNKGTTQGQLAVEFNGEVENLKSIGNVDQVHYQGTIADGLADTLVQANNDLLQVSPNGSVGIHTEEDVHLKDVHDVAHSIQIQTKGNLTTNQQLKSGGSIGLHSDKTINHNNLDAAQSVNMVARDKITAQSNVQRMEDGTNYEDKLTQITLKAGNAATLTAGSDINYEAVRVQSGKGGTHLKAAGKIIAKEKTTEKHIESYKTNKTKSKVLSKTETIKKSVVSEYKSKGPITMQAHDTCELHGTTIDTTGAKEIYGKNGVHGHAVYDTHHSKADYTKDGGWFGTSKKADKETISQTAKRVDFKGKSNPEIFSDKKIPLPFTSDSEKVVFNAPDQEIPKVQNVSVSTAQASSENLVWESEKRLQEEKVTLAPLYKGTIETNGKTLQVPEVKDQAPLIIDKKNPDIKITKQLFTEIHNHQKISTQGPTRAATMVIVLAVTMATSGFGSSLGVGLATSVGIKSTVATTAIANMSSAVVTSYATQATDQLLRCNGDFHAAAKNIASLDAFKKAALSAATAGTISCANSAIAQVVPSVSEGTSLLEKLAYAAPRQAATGAIRTASSVAAGSNIKEAVIENVRSAAADTINIAAASQIGDAYHEGTINPVTHKVLHTATGALSGAIVDGKRGAAAGATGSLVAETVADVFSPKKPSLERMRVLEEKLGHRLTQEEFVIQWNNQAREYMQQVSNHADVSKFAAASVALLARQDVAIAHNTGAIAVDNNFLGLIGLGVVAGSAAYSAYNVYTAYQDEGAYGAAKQLGIEVITEVAGIATGAVAGKVIGKVGYKLGSKIYPTMKCAVNAALEARPCLKIALGKFSNTLIAGAEKCASTSIGKGLIKAETWALKQTAKISTAVEGHLSGLGEDLAAAHVPGSVAAKMEGRAAAKVAQAEVDTTLHSIPTRLRPLGLGSTGRTEAASLHEQIVLEGVMADPSIGKEIEIKKGMTDHRWPQENGWKKMRYRNDEHGIEIHYVAQYKDDIITAIDDFKIKNSPRPMFFDYQGKK